MDINELRDSYDQVAGEYVTRIFHELEHKPMDRALLDRFAAEVQGLGTICDMGCGPGHVAQYLHERGVHVLGIDVSPRMVEQARQLNPGIESGSSGAFCDRTGCSCSPFTLVRRLFTWMNGGGKR